MNKKEIVSERIKKAMSMRGISAADLSAKSGVSEPSISQYVNAKHAPDNRAAGKLAKVLDVSPIWLMGFENVPMIINEDTTPSPALYKSVERHIVKNEEGVSPLMADLIESLSMEYIAQKNPDAHEVYMAYIHLSTSERNMVRKMLDLPPIDEKREESQSSAS